MLTILAILAGPIVVATVDGGLSHSMTVTPVRTTQNHIIACLDRVFSTEELRFSANIRRAASSASFFELHFSWKLLLDSE
jgi:hypothetical protein